MAIFGSYIGKDRSLLGESVTIAALDTFVAITSGLIIFPACFTFGVDQTQEMCIRDSTDSGCLLSLYSPSIL